MDRTWQLSVYLFFISIILHRGLTFLINDENVCFVNNRYTCLNLYHNHTQYCNDFYKKCPLLHKTFKTWNFSAVQVLYKTFPLDPLRGNYVRQVRNAIFSVTFPIPLKKNVQLAAVSEDALISILDIDPVMSKSDKFLKMVSGGLTISPSIPLSHRYGGHQFGSWAEQLGDGRAVMLGEYVNTMGERWELQLKGSGLTPYSRRGDGRAVIRSSVREFLCSEAMYFLGIPTSRAASLVVSNDPVIRDQFYDGHPVTERAAVVLRLAKSWFRIGSLEILTKNHEYDLLKKLVDFVIERYFEKIDIEGSDQYLEFYSQIVSQTAEMIAKWQSVGFTHGVCNTDNFSLLSITIDYGPFGFMDAYDPGFVPNNSDDEGRYSYERQPEVGIFNLDKLGIALLPLLDKVQRKQMGIILKGYENIYKQEFMKLFRKKLGLTDNQGEDDEQLVAILLRMMEDTKADFTMTFRDLSEVQISVLQKNIPEKFWALQTLQKHKWFTHWVQTYALRVSGISENVRTGIMKRSNPRYILRNWIAQQVIHKTENDNFSDIYRVLEILKHPYDYQENAEKMGLASPPPSWAKNLKVSCSS